MSKTTRRDLGGIPIFLAFAAVLIGLSVLTFRAVLLSGTKATAYLRVNREVVNGNAADFMIFNEMQASLLKSDFVLKAATLSDDLTHIDVTVQELAGNLQVEVNEDELLCVHLTSRGRGKAETEAILNAVLAAYQTEIVHKERMEKVERLAKLRERYQEIYDDIVEQTEMVKVVAKRGHIEAKDQLHDKRLKLLQHELEHQQLQLAELKRTEEVTQLIDEQIKSVTESIAKTKSQIEMFESSLAELNAHGKSLTALNQDLQLVLDEKEKLESDLEGRDTVQIIQQAWVN